MNDAVSTHIDIFQLGKLFGRIVALVKEEFSSMVLQKLELIVDSMTTETKDDVLELTDISKLLKQIINASALG